MDQKIKSVATQRLLMESAFSLFYRNGYGLTSIPAIVKQAGLSKGAFYHHFENKKDLGEKTLSYIVRDRLYKHMIAPLSNPEEKPSIPLLIEVFSNRINSFSDEEGQMGCPLNNLINELAFTEDRFRTEMRSIIDEWKTALIKLIEEGKQKQEIRNDVDAQSTAIYLISAYEGARGIGKLYNSKLLLQQFLDGVVAYLEQLK